MVFLQFSYESSCPPDRVWIRRPDSPMRLRADDVRAGFAEAQRQEAAQPTQLGDVADISSIRGMHVLYVKFV